MLRATTACTFSTSQLPKVVRTPGVFNILTSKCASRHNGVHFFDISTSKSGPHLVCFVHFDFEMCFAPQRHALFDIATSKRGPNMVCFVHFDFEIVSRHNGVQFFISHLASWLRTRRFSEPSGAPNHWKNTVFRDFPTFSRICIFFLLIFSLLTLFTSAFQLSILSEVSLLNFLRLRKIISADPCCGGERVREATFVKQFEKTCWVTVVSCFKLFSVHPKRRQALVKGMECNGTGPRHRCDQPPVFCLVPKAPSGTGCTSKRAPLGLRW